MWDWRKKAMSLEVVSNNLRILTNTAADPTGARISGALPGKYADSKGQFLFAASVIDAYRETKAGDAVADDGIKAVCRTVKTKVESLRDVGGAGFNTKTMHCMAGLLLAIGTVLGENPGNPSKPGKSK